MNVRPTYDRVVVEKASDEEVSKGGIIIPDVARNPTQMGKVLAVGPGRNIDAPGGYRLNLFDPDGKEIPFRARPAGALGQVVGYVEVERPQMQVKVGDTVLWGKHAGSEVKVGEQIVYILREDEILAVIDAPAAVETPAP